MRLEVLPWGAGSTWTTCKAGSTSQPPSPANIQPDLSLWTGLVAQTHVVQLVRETPNSLILWLEVFC